MNTSKIVKIIIVLTFIMIVVSLSFIFLFISMLTYYDIIVPPHVYLGTKTATVPREYTTIRLNAGNMGLIIIEMAPDDADYLLHSEIEVYGESDYNFDLVDTVTYSDAGNETVDVNFFYSVGGVEPIPFSCNVRFLIVKDIKLELNIRGGYYGLNVTLSDLIITDIYLHYASYGTNNLNNLELTRVKFNGTNPEISIFSGYPMKVNLVDINYTTYQTNWTIHGPMHDIALNIEQNVEEYLDNVTRSFDIESKAMNTLSVATILPPSYGVKVMTAGTETTSSLPGGGTTHISSGYETAPIKYEFILSSPHGNITFTRD
ncbi:MAG: hypothetical protein ACXADA_14910 [Candidatus Hodarchaeales archaeon]|jgi:hypothetical protein